MKTYPQGSVVTVSVTYYGPSGEQVEMFTRSLEQPTLEDVLSSGLHSDASWEAECNYYDGYILDYEVIEPS